MSKEVEDRIAAVKQRAHGHWTGVLQAIGVDAKVLNGKGQPCPKCGGTDRFAYSDKYGEGDSYCRTCGHRDGFALAQLVTGLSFVQVLERVEAHLGTVTLRPVAPAKSTGRGVKQLIERLLRESLPVQHGDEVDLYLRARGIVLDEFPDTLRFHPSLGYYERIAGGTKSKQLGTCPAMIALVHAPDGELVTLHRTYLRSGRKAFGGESKKLLSSGIHGAAVRLHPAGDTLGLTEGIETGLAVRLRTGHPVWAAINCLNLERLLIPDTVRRICIYADNDANSQFDGQASAYALARRLKKESRRYGVDREVHVHVPRHAGTDWADVYASMALKAA
jgi:putative DNA primase/helicase